MIVKAKKRHIKDICALWSEAFGDDESKVGEYLDFLLAHFFVDEENGCVLAMASAIPLKIGNKKGRYIYAVATDKKERGKGRSTALLEFLKEYIKENNEDFLILVPAQKTLFDFYQKRGFTIADLKIKKTSFDNTEIYKNASINKISAKDYQKMRKNNAKNPAHWEADALDFAKKMYNGEFLSVEEDKKTIGGGFCFLKDDTLVVKEIFAQGKDFSKVVMALTSYFEVKKAEYSALGAIGDDFFMVYPSDFKDAYFNIALD